MSPAEKVLVEERARGAGLTVSEYLRGLGLGGPAPKNGRGAPRRVTGGAGPAGLEVREDPTVRPGVVEVRDAGGRLAGSIENVGSHESGGEVGLLAADGRGAAELERGGLVRTGTSGSGSAAPAFRCPVDYGPEPCVFRAKSPRVTCPVHGRKVVPV